MRREKQIPGRCLPDPRKVWGLIYDREHLPSDSSWDYFRNLAEFTSEKNVKHDFCAPLLHPDASAASSKGDLDPVNSVVKRAVTGLTYSRLMFSSIQLGALAVRDREVPLACPELARGPEL